MDNIIIHKMDSDTRETPPEKKAVNFLLKPPKGIQKAKLNYFHADIKYSDGKKEPINPEGYKESKFENPMYFNRTTEKGTQQKNKALCLLMGQTIIKDNINYKLICLDIDDKEKIDKRTNTNILNGLTKWKELMNEHKFKTETPRAETPSGGKHYFFIVDEQTFNKLPTSITEMTIDKIKYSIDMKINDQYIYIEPTYYKKSNEWVKYKFISDDFDKIELCPEWLLKLIFNHLFEQTPNQKEKKQITNKQLKEYTQFKQIIEKATEEEIKFFEKVLKFIDIKDIKEDVNKWLNVGRSLFFSGCDVEMWDNWSKGAKNYTGNKGAGCFYRWEKIIHHYDVKKLININHNFSIFKLLGYAYEKMNKEESNDLYKEACKIEKFSKILQDKQLNKMSIDEIFNNNVKYPSYDIDNEFLLPQTEEINKIKEPKNDQERMINYLFEFVESKKAMLIKSHLGSGKTQAIKRLINIIKATIQVINKTTENESVNLRIIMITHRQSLSYNLEDEFKKIGFSNYLNKDEIKYTDDKIIISMESLHKIYKEYKEVDETPKYDLVILDELESLLYHTKSPTHGDDNQRNYRLLEHLCNNSNKILGLDGDISQRALYFINSITTNNIFIKNVYKTNKTYKIFEDVEYYNDFIFKCLDNNENLYIFSMEKDKAKQYEELINEKYKDKKVLVIHGDMDDMKKKQIFINVNEEWRKYNVVITTSTTEAGVNFDPRDEDNKPIKHFSKILCILGSSITQRQLLQCLARVRNPTDSENIYVHNGKYKYTRNYSFTTYQDIKDNTKYSMLDEIYTNDKTYENYKQICIFNDVEDRNKERNFIEYFELLIKERGGKIEYTEKAEDKKKQIKPQKYKFNNILTANYIYDATEKELIMKKKESNKATEQEKYNLMKTTTLNYFGFLKYEIEHIEQFIEFLEFEKNKNPEKKESCNKFYYEFLKQSGNFRDEKEADDLLQKQHNLYFKFDCMLEEFINVNKAKHFLYLIDKDNLTKKYDTNKKIWIDKDKDILRITTEKKVDAINELMKLFKINDPTQETELKNFDSVIRKNYKKLQLFSDKDIYKHDYDIFMTEKGKEDLQPILNNVNSTLKYFGIEIKCEIGKQKRISKTERIREPSKYIFRPLEAVDTYYYNKMRNITAQKKKNPEYKQTLNDSKLFLNKYVPVEPSIEDIFNIQHNEEETEHILYDTDNKK
jgi:hypothetical protein